MRLAHVLRRGPAAVVRRAMRAWLCACVAALLLLPSALAAAEIAGKRPVVEDGDTLILAGTRIELHGLDAPEIGQTCRQAGGDWACGAAARRALIHRIAFHWVNCVAQPPGPDGRQSSVCYLGAVGGPELNAWLVAEGWALADPTTGGRYAQAQAAARADRRGLWTSRFLAPWDWRQGQRLADE